MKSFSFFVAILFLILAPLAATQSRSSAGKASGAGAHKLLAVKATGSTRYTANEILAASGLTLGQIAAEDDFKEAVHRLGSSGLFSEVLYSFSYSDQGVKVEFQLTDTDKIKLVPAHFENFVWFTDPELHASLERRVPLFKDALPATGQMPDQITQALQALLDEHHLPGRVDFIREAKPNGGDVTGVTFRVEEMSIVIRTVEFPGASADQAAFLASSARKLVGAQYSRAMIATVAEYDLRALFLQRGYLKAAFSPAGARVIAPAAEQSPGQASTTQADNKPQEETEVDAIIPVAPGKQYSVSEVGWKGNSAVATQDAARLLHLTPGQPADAVRLDRDLETLTKLYRSRGYMAVQIKPDPQMEDEKSLVHYIINVSEGDVYKMGELEILGVDTTSKDRLRGAWSLREGQPYNSDYTRKFLVDNVSLLPKGARYSTKISEELTRRTRP